MCAKLVVDHMSFSVFDSDSYTAQFQKLNEHSNIFAEIKLFLICNVFVNVGRLNKYELVNWPGLNISLSLVTETLCCSF